MEMTIDQKKLLDNMVRSEFDKIEKVINTQNSLLVYGRVENQKIIRMYTLYKDLFIKQNVTNEYANALKQVTTYGS